MEIKQLEALVKPLLTNGYKFVSYEIENLLSSGENYGSVMLRVDIKVLNTTGKEEIIHCVAKTCPLSEFFWKIFNTKVTFKKEIAIYNTIVPLLNKFAAEKGVDNLLNFFAKPLGARLSLDPTSDVVDKDAVLLLENIKTQGYDILDRYNGFDLETTKLLLRDLATLHAAPLAFKLAHPEEFKSQILPYLSKHEFQANDNGTSGFTALITEAAARNPECIPLLPKISNAMENMKKTLGQVAMEPLATLTHNDFWVNNTMIKMVDGKPQKNVMVDFQIIEYSSPAHDVIFFLYSSVATSVLKQGKIDELIKYYYDHFIDTLKKLKCDVSIFSFDKLMEECAIVAKEREFTHILFMLTPIFLLKDKAKDLSQYKENDVLCEENSMHENYYEKLHFFLLDFHRRGWMP